MAGEILDLVNEDASAAGRLVRGIESAVGASFKTHPMRNKTLDEVKRRGRICVDYTRELRKDMKWSIARIVDELPAALRAKLDGVDWKPSTRTFWTPDDNDAERVYVPDGTITT